MKMNFFCRIVGIVFLMSYAEAASIQDTEKEIAMRQSTPQCSIDFTAHLNARVRDFWWNPDFKALLQKRSGIKTAQKVLDVGCGQGHWTREIASLVASNAVIVGVDAEEKWIQHAMEHLPEHPDSQAQFSFQIGNAYALSFADETFDLVTCQTLLMHLGDPEKAIAEMTRVLKKGGQIILAEPNNFPVLARSNTAQMQLSREEEMDIVHFYLILEEGKKKLKEGEMSIYKFLPKFLKQAGCSNIQYYQNDTAFSLQPPYDADPRTKAMIQFIKFIVEKDYFLIFPPDSIARYFDTISQDQELFKRLCATSKKLNTICGQQIKDNTLEGTFSTQMFIAIGQK